MFSGTSKKITPTDFPCAMVDDATMQQTPAKLQNINDLLLVSLIFCRFGNRIIIFTKIWGGSNLLIAGQFPNASPIHGDAHFTSNWTPWNDIMPMRWSFVFVLLVLQLDTARSSNMCYINFKRWTSLETAMVHEQCTRFTFFIFWPSRGRHGKNVKDESCSTRRALLAYQLSFETVENPRSSMPNLLIFLTFSKFVTL